MAVEISASVQAWVDAYTPTVNTLDAASACNYAKNDTFLAYVATYPELNGRNVDDIWTTDKAFAKARIALSHKYHVAQLATLVGYEATAGRTSGSPTATLPLAIHLLTHDTVSLADVNMTKATLCDGINGQRAQAHGLGINISHDGLSGKGIGKRGGSKKVIVLAGSEGISEKAIESLMAATKQTREVVIAMLNAK